MNKMNLHIASVQIQLKKFACRSFSPISSSPAAHVEASGEGIAALEEYPGRQLDNRDAKTPGSRRTMSLHHEIEWE